MRKMLVVISSLCSVLILILPWPLAHAFYLPGVAPRDFHTGENLQVKVNKLSSTKTQLPYDYYFLSYCKPPKVVNSAENLGEVLHGDHIENSVYIFKMRQPQSCKVACRVKLDAASAKGFKEKIDDVYRVNMGEEDEGFLTTFLLQSLGTGPMEIKRRFMNAGFVSDTKKYLMGTKMRDIL